MPQGDEQRHVVVFDCNVYLDVGRALGAPFTWEAFNAQVASLTKVAVPHPKMPVLDSLRAIALCTSGRFAGTEVLEVWTNAHIDKMVRGKARTPATPDPLTGFKGLGWSRRQAQGIVNDLIGSLVQQSNGGTLGSHVPSGNPPLDHEDGMVYGACAQLASDDPICKVYCVTRDRGFLTAYREGALADHTRVVTPAKFIALIRAARFEVSTRAMRPPPSASA